MDGREAGRQAGRQIDTTQRDETERVGVVVQTGACR